ncbi:MAG: caspase family protein, partial [Trichodesmium sp. MAG_R03]|nr:caspase family protein [Trichodesmium sp. MAG_R03]
MGRNSRKALVVGINRYPWLKEKELGDLNLEAPVKDAEAIANILEKYGKFQVEHLPKDYDEENREIFNHNKGLESLVKIDDLKQAIINLFKPPLENETPDVALLFFAGHGDVKIKEDVREGFLVTSDASNTNFGISFTWLKKLLQDSPVQKQIVWLDCCFGGQFLSFDREANPDIEGKQISRCFMTASRSFEAAQEKWDGKHGLFTYNLLSGLNPENHVDGWVTNHILTKYIQERMYQTSQAPMCYNSGKTIILTTKSLNEPLGERRKNVPPYRGLSYFGQQENDGVFFHGRTGLTDKLIEQVKNH